MKNNYAHLSQYHVDDTNIKRIETCLKLHKVQSNNTSGVSGVSWHKKTQKWSVKLKFQKKTHYFGYYHDLVEAKEVRLEAEKDIYQTYLDQRLIAQ